MARPREPLSLIEAKGRKHLTQKEKEGRLASHDKYHEEGEMVGSDGLDGPF